MARRLKARAPRGRAARRARFEQLAASLPDVQLDATHAPHLQLKVRGKSFAWYVDDHHGDGRVALHVKAPRGMQARLLREAPERCFVPPYVGDCGWVGLWLDQPSVDWAEVFARLADGYRMTAPRKLQVRLDAGLA